MNYDAETEDFVRHGFTVYDSSLLGATEQEHCDRLFAFGRLDGWLRHKTVVDVGCGVGGVLEHMRRAYPENAFAGVTNSEVQAGALYDKRLIPIILDMDSGELPRADLFVFQQSIGHALDMPAVVADCARKMHDGGRLLIKDFDCEAVIFAETWAYRHEPAANFIAAASANGLTLLDVKFPPTNHDRFLNYWRTSEYMRQRHGQPYGGPARTALYLFEKPTGMTPCP